MALAPGQQLGVYEVRDLIGAGGMGDVYRGLDTKLNRHVAIKILPDTFALDASWLSRFKREAQVLASLNHSNIASIFGFEDTNGLHALVLELVDGPTLAELIARGPIPLDDALPIARQIADALEAAHAQGIVHRDLKPANIKIRPDGTVKVLDFGLAKALIGEASPGTPTRSLTITSPAVTQLGVILGTAAYMSPEQARGKSVDKRSDIWAFGGVLYEMLAGRRAFDGDDVSDTLANVLKREPDWQALPRETPSHVQRVLRRCLEKDPRRRLHDIADVRLELDEQDAVSGSTAAPAPARLRNRERAAWALVALLLAAGLTYTLRRPAPVSPVVRFQIAPPAGGSFGSSTGVGRSDGTSGSALSPDGSQIALVVEESKRPSIWVRRLDAFAARRIAGTEDALMPFWSPDGRALGFFAGGKLKRVDLADGVVQTLCDVRAMPRGASWGRDVIVFSHGTPAQLQRVSSRGGPVATVTLAGVIYPRWPSFLPDGQRFLVLGRLQSDNVQGLIQGSIEPGVESRRIVASDSNGQFVSPGVLLFLRESTLMQQQVDPDRLSAIGDPTPVIEQVFQQPGSNRGDFSVSQTGVLAFRTRSNHGTQFAWFTRKGERIEDVGRPGNYRAPVLSPDMNRLAYGDVDQGDIWILDLARRTSSRLTASPGTQGSPVWFPDGSKLAYRTDGGGLFEKDAGGSDEPVQVLKESVNGPSQVTPDGKWVLYFAVSSGGTQDVYIVPTSGDRTPKAIVTTPFAADVEPQVSPNMRWLAYASNETGAVEVYVQRFPTGIRKGPLSTSGGRQPLWRADGKELFFVADDGRFYVVPFYDRDESFDFGVPEFLFQMPANVYNTRNSYIPSRDGQRFLVNTVIGTEEEPISVVHNWQAAAAR